MFGYANVADVIGRPTSVFVAPEAFAAIRERNRTRDEQPYEALARRKDGSAFPAEFVGREIEWQGRRARVGVARDLTERKRAEDALRERENRLRLVTDAVPVLISFVDAEERYRFNNKAYEDWFGHKREEITGRTLREVLGDAAREALDPHVRAALAGERVRFESRVSYRDGGLRWIEADYVPKLSAGGRVEGFYALVHDATARKEAEARQAFLLALGDRLRSLADPREVMASAAELLGRHLDAGCAGYSEVDGAGDHVTIERDWTAPGFASVAGIHRLDDYGPALIAELRAGRAVKIEDTAADPLTAGPIQQATYAAIATRAFVDAPLVKTGRLAAILYVLNRAPRVWADSEVALVEEVAERTWAAVERARAEAALRESERLLRAIGESSADCIYAKDRDGRMLYANPATLAVVGKIGDQVLGRHEAEWHDNPAEGDAIRANDRLVMESGVAQRLEEVFTTPGGAERIYQSTKSPMHDADGRIIGLVGVTTDVTERRRAEEAVRHSEARLTAFMENSPGSLFIKDAAGRYMVVNHAFLAGAGKPAEEVVGKTDADLFPPGMAAEFAAEDHAVRESGEPRRFEGTFEHAGRRRTFLSQKFPLPRGAVGCVGTDITERKLAEAALRESEARFRDMADNAPVMVWVTDPTGYCTYLGRSWYEFTGQTPENGLGHGWLDATHPDDREAAGAAFRVANERREAFRLEYRLRRKDGVYRWAIDAAAPAFGADGAFAGYIGSVIDITERKQAEESQLLLLEELNHRVKNTLAMVQSIAAQTLRFSEAPEGFPEAFQARLRALAQAHDLLTRSHWQEASLREVVDMTLDPHAGEQRVRVDGPGVALTPAVAVSLHLAFHELATNAAKYGALSVGGGSVDLNWRVVDGPGPALRIEWHETGGPPVLPPSRRGFGSRLIERGLAHELDGEVGIDFDHTGVRCRITIPLSQRIRAA
jgi:PAS domain S-box-containing protein